MQSNITTVKNDIKNISAYEMKSIALFKLNRYQQIIQCNYKIIEID